MRNDTFDHQAPKNAALESLSRKSSTRALITVYSTTKCVFMHLALLYTWDNRQNDLYCNDHYDLSGTIIRVFVLIPISFSTIPTDRTIQFEYVNYTLLQLYLGNLQFNLWPIKFPLKRARNE